MIRMITTNVYVAHGMGVSFHGPYQSSSFVSSRRPVFLIPVMTKTCAILRIMTASHETEGGAYGGVLFFYPFL